VAFNLIAILAIAIAAGWLVVILLIPPKLLYALGCFATTPAWSSQQGDAASTPGRGFSSSGA
jgi:hypothetical protein